MRERKKKSVLMLKIFEWKCNNVKKYESKKEINAHTFNPDRLKCGKNKK